LKLLNASRFAFLYDGELEGKSRWKGRDQTHLGEEMAGAVQTEEVREAAGRVYLFQARRV
jgi:hypothetical protein